VISIKISIVEKDDVNALQMCIGYAVQEFVILDSIILNIEMFNGTYTRNVALLCCRYVQITNLVCGIIAS